MSARNPLTIVKETVFSALNRAYHIRKLRETDAIVEFIDDEVTALISPKITTTLLRRAWIRDLITSRLEQTDFFSEQPDLFRDLGYQFAFRKHHTTYQRALGDLSLSEVIALQHRKKSNIRSAQFESDRFDRAVAIVRPLLEANPEWLWRDAVAYLETHGGIPDIA